MPQKDMAEVINSLDRISRLMTALQAQFETVIAILKKPADDEPEGARNGQ